MGYYTYFEFEAPDTFVEYYKRNEEDLDDLLDGHSFYWKGCPEKPNLFTAEESYKFYEWETCFAKLSKSYPDDVFTVRGNGEEPGDMWVAYFKNGKMQYCEARITYDEFDESKLTEPKSS